MAHFLEVEVPAIASHGWNNWVCGMGLTTTCHIGSQRCNPFTYFLVPAVLWVIATYGIIPESQIAFPWTAHCDSSASALSRLITHSPSWSSSRGRTGPRLIMAWLLSPELSALSLAWTLVPLSDRIGAYLAWCNKGIRKAEMRLVILFPPMIISPQVLFCMFLRHKISGPDLDIWLGRVCTISVHWFALQMPWYLNL